MSETGHESLTQDQGIIEILLGRIANKEREIASLQLEVIVKNQELEQLKSDG